MVEAGPVARSLQSIREGIAKAAAPAGRQAGDVTLIAVSKTRPADAILPLLEAGHRDFGENRVAEAAGKWPALREAYPDVRLHMIGALQSNKAEAAAALFDVLHSLDRASLIDAVVRAADRTGRRLPCFLQVNLATEPQKSGCAVAELPSLLAQARTAGLEIAGLMCLPPVRTEPAPYFALLAKLAREEGVAGLSMGMSDDYRTAVMLGATHVRIGTALFGERGL